MRTCPPLRHPARGALRATALLVALVLGTTSCSAATSTAPAPSPSAAPRVVAPSTQELVAGITVARAPEKIQAPTLARVPGAPRRVVVPSLGVDAPVVDVAAPGGVLTPPADPQQLGWWSEGAPPGADRGSALVTGHTVHAGGGALDDLEQLGRGDVVEVFTDAGRIAYTVGDTEVLGKGELARRALELFDQSSPGRLVLITCEDWNGVEYLSNVVVTASPARGAG